jgi:hypothetical protein
MRHCTPTEAHHSVHCSGATTHTSSETKAAYFKLATQGPVIEWLKTKIDVKLIDSVQAAVKEADTKK